MLLLAAIMTAGAQVHAAEVADPAQETGGRSAASEAEAESSTAPAPKRPGYTFLRQNEDWSVVPRLAESDRDALDPIKYVPLTKDGSSWASFGGSARMRLESWRGFNFGAPSGANHDDEFVFSRALLHGDFHFGRRLRIFAEGKSAQATDRDLPGGRRPTDLDTLDVQQLFVDLSVPLQDDSRLTLRLGRQMLLFGAQRLVNPAPWSNTLRTWDGVTAILRRGTWTVTGMATAFVPVTATEFNEADEEHLLYGVYAASATPKAPRGLDVYWLGVDRDDRVVAGVIRDEERQTLGARRWGKLSDALDYEVEGAYQFGSLDGADISAGTLAGELGWRPGGVWNGRFSAGVEYATGDERAGDDRVGTFVPPFPAGHPYFGFIDTIGRLNIVDGVLGAGFSPIRRLNLSATHHAFWLAEREDALYNPGGGVVRAPGSFGSRFVGTELDLVATYRPDRHTAIQLGYSRFFAGDAIEDSGPAEDIDFGYLSLEYTF